MRVHWLQHVPFEGLGSIGPWLAARGAQIGVTRLFEAARFPRLDGIDWLIAMGGPMSVNEERAHPWLVLEKRFVAEAIDAGKRVLGICLGAQLVASALGTKVFPNDEREIGWFPVEPVEAVRQTPFARVFEAPQEVFHWHGETFDLPTGATHLARSAVCAHQAFCVGDRVLGLQFHLEMTVEGAAALTRHCPGDLAPGRWVQSEREMLRDASRFERSHRAMDALLDVLAG